MHKAALLTSIAMMSATHRMDRQKMRAAKSITRSASAMPGLISWAALSAVAPFRASSFVAAAFCAPGTWHCPHEEQLKEHLNLGSSMTSTA